MQSRQELSGDSSVGAGSGSWSQAGQRALKIAGTYAVCGFLWIILSDRILARLIQDSATLTRFQTYKGWVFILITAALVFALSRIALRKTERLSMNVRESERQFRALFENLNVAALVIDPSDGTILDANEAAAAFYGWPRDQLRSMNISQINTLSPDEIRARIDEARIRKRGFFLFSHRRADGTVRTVEVYSGPLQLEGKTALYSIIHDVTERKREEEVVAEQGAFVLQIMDTASVAIFLVDKIGRITHANRRMAEMFGCSMEELIGSEYMAHVHPKEREAGRRNMLALLASEIPSVDLERFYLRKDGTEFWGHLAGRRFHDVHGSDLGLIGVISDITERKRAVDALRENEEKYKLLIEATNTGFVIIDHRGRVLDANQEYVRMTGHGRLEDIVGRPITDWTAGYDLERNAAEVRKCMKTGSVRNLVIDYVDSKGTTTPVEINATVLPGLTEARVFTICRDITERKQMEEELRESEARTRSIIESIPVGMHMYRLEPDGRLVFIGANPAADKILGVDNSTFIGKTIEDAFPPLKDTEVPQRYREVAVTGKAWQTVSIEYRDNTIRGAFEVHAFQTAPNSMVAAFEDVTQRKRSEMALKESEAKYRILYNETPVLLHSIDRNGTVVEVNDYWLKTLGYERHEVIGRKVVDFFTEASRKYALEVVQPAFFRDGIANDIPYQFVKKNGDIVDVLLSASSELDAAGTVVRSLAVIEDVTEKKRAEESLRESQARFQAFFEQSNDGITVADMEGHYMMVNPAFCRMTGYSREELLNMRVQDLLPGKAEPRLFMQVSIGKRAEHREGELQRKDGSRFFVSVSGTVLQIGTAQFVHGIVQDITIRKQADEALRQSEERFKAITMTASDAILLMDDRGKLVHWNPAAERMFDYSAEEALGKDLHLFLGPQRLQENFQRGFGHFARTGKGPVINKSVELTAVKKDGKEFPIEVSTSAMNIGGRWHALGIIRDITERKRAAEALRDSERMLQAIFETEPDCIKVLDNESRLIMMNHAGLSMLQVDSLEQVKGQFVCPLVAPEHRQEFMDLTQRVFRGGSGSLEFQMVGMKGKHLWLETHAVPLRNEKNEIIALLGVTRDITARKRAEEELRENQARLDLALQSAHMGVWRWEIEENRRYFDDLTCQLLGIEAAAFTGTTEEFFRAVHPEDRERVKAALARTLEQGVPYEPEYRVVWPEGSIHYITARGRLVRDDKGQPARVNGILWDITEQRLLEEERLKAHKLESIGTLAGGIAHDFNNLLQGVFGYISMAKLTFDQREKSLAMLEQAEKALHQSVNLTSQLLTFSKGGKPMRKVIDLRPVIENAVKFALSGSRVEYELSFDDDLHPVEADEGQIGQVVQNIVLNAEQAMPLGGRIDIAARNVPAASPLAGVPEGLTGDLVEITVRDQGMGIPPEHLPKIFDPYFTTKEKGSGLGLATSYSIIKNHDGLIRVSSELSRGTQFTIQLPASVQKPELPARLPAPDPGRGGRILIMDDEEVVRKVAEELLRALGYDVEVAAHGESALVKYREARAAGRPFDVVILDLTIRGGMGGEKTVRQLLEIDPGVRAVVSSGYSDDEVVSSYRQYGFRSFLKKPYNIEALRSVLDELMA